MKIGDIITYGPCRLGLSGALLSKSKTGVFFDINGVNEVRILSIKNLDLKYHDPNQYEIVIVPFSKVFWDENDVVIITINYNPDSEKGEVKRIKQFSKENFELFKEEVGI